MHNKKTILVTGGLGYIGSHTVVELIENGYEVLIIDDLSNSRRDVLSNIKKITGVEPLFYCLSLLEKNKVSDVFENHNIDAVIHFAAHLFVGESVEKPLKYYTNNLVSLLNLLEIMKISSVKNLVFSSSCTVYGEPDLLPISEKSPIKEASSPYGTTKVMGEKIIKDICELEQNTNAIALRYFNPVGAHDSALIGEFPKGTPKHLFPIISKVLKGQTHELKVFGDDYNTKDGTAVRDYIHVVDLAKAHIKALERLESKKMIKKFESFNIGTGTGYSVLEIVNSFEEVTKQKIKYSIVERREGDIAEIWADSLLAKEQLGWESTKTLKDMISSAFNWEKTIIED
jgi:UDP-glucose 4-epimerase